MMDSVACSDLNNDMLVVLLEYYFFHFLFYAL